MFVSRLGRESPYNTPKRGGGRGPCGWALGTGLEAHLVAAPRRVQALLPIIQAQGVARC